MPLYQLLTSTNDGAGKVIKKGKDMAASEVTEWTLDGALDEMKRIHNTMKDRQFAFILGAGASFTSGIPTGQDLAERWLRDLHLRECSDGSSLENWIARCNVGEGEITLQAAAEYYPQIFERRFEGDREAGYAELEAAMEGKAPSLGYSLLAEIIQHTRHKVVVTTNFDNLVADALAMHAHQSPLVVAHESLAGFVRPQMRRPLVAKIHRDLYLHPINDIAGVSTMEQAWKIALKKLFQYFTPVVVGYGGNDGSLMNMLMGLDQGDIAGRMIWCYRAGSLPPEKALSVLSKHKGLLVKIPGFDEFMLQLAAKLVSNFDVADIAERTEKLGLERATRYREQATSLSESSLHGSPAEQRAGEVLTQSLRASHSWWAWETKAKEEPDIEKRKLIYLEGMRVFPNSPDLTGHYARFLDLEFKNADETEAIYLKALELDPEHARNTGDYASFVEERRKDYDKAELFYKKAIELDPHHGSNISSYANFLVKHRQDDNAAEMLYKKALEFAPTNVWNMCNFARFMVERRDDYDVAETLYKKAIELDPSSVWAIGSYANFLAYTRKNNDAAKALFEKAITLNPNNSWSKSNLARFLLSQQQPN